MEENIIYLPAGSNIVKFTKDKEDTSIIERTSLNIDWTWVIEEDGVLKYRGEQYEVKAGDIVMLCYAPYIKCTGRETTRRVIIVKSEDLYDNWLKCKQYYNKQDEQIGCKSYCENCSNCNYECCGDSPVEPESAN